jgi:hypothetical protein
VSDFDTVVVDSLKALDPNRPIREEKRTCFGTSFASRYYAVGPQARQRPPKKSLSTGRLSEYPTNYFVGICIKTSAMAEQNTMRLPRVNFSDCRLCLPPLEK